MSADQTRTDYSALRRGIVVLFVVSFVALLFAGRYHRQEHRYSSDGVATTGYVTGVTMNPLSEDGYVMTVTYADPSSRSHIVRVSEEFYSSWDANDEIGETRPIQYLASDPGTGRIPSWFNVPIWVGYALSLIPALIGLLGLWGMSGRRSALDQSANVTEGVEQSEPTMESDFDELYNF